LRELFLRRARIGANSDEAQTHSAIFVALLKLGESGFLENNSAAIPQRGFESWYAAVGARRGWTSLGPNNCQGANTGGDWPSAFGPSLVYQNGGWVEFAGR
jgi:hypothetical protein